MSQVLLLVIEMPDYILLKQVNFICTENIKNEYGTLVE